MIAIVNVDKNIRNTGPHEYELRINGRVITKFIHNREESLSECLMMAATAVKNNSKKDSTDKLLSKSEFRRISFT